MNVLWSVANYSLNHAKRKMLKIVSKLAVLYLRKYACIPLLFNLKNLHLKGHRVDSVINTHPHFIPNLYYVQLFLLHITKEYILNKYGV